MDNDTTETHLNLKARELPKKAFAGISFFFNGKEISFNRDDLPINIGRDDSTCQLTIDEKIVSRVHCTIEERNNQPGVCDKSTNGTFVKLGRAESVHVCKNYFPLVGQGVMKLGEEIELDDPNVLLFKIRF